MQTLIVYGWGWPLLGVTVSPDFPISSGPAISNISFGYSSNKGVYEMENYLNCYINFYNISIITLSGDRIHEF